MMNQVDYGDDYWNECDWPEVEYKYLEPDVSSAYDIEVTEYKIYGRTLGNLAAVLKSPDEGVWTIEIKLVQDAHSFNELSKAIQRAITNKVR